MADEINKRVGIDVVATASGDGTEKIAAGLEKDEAASHALKQATEELAATQAKAAAESGESKNTAELARQKDLLEQKRTLESDVTRQIALQAAGQKEEAEALAQQIAIRKLAIQLQQQLRIGQEEAVEIATRRIMAEEAIAAAIEQQAVAQEAANAANERGFLGARGLHHMLGEAGEGLGLGPLLFQAWGLFELIKMIFEASQRHAEAIKKAKEEQQKLNDEVAKEADQLDKIKSLAEVESERAKTQEKIAELHEKRAHAEGEEYDSLTSQITAEESILDKLDGMTAAAIARQEKEHQNQLALEAQTKALDAINEKYADAIKNVEAVLRAHEKIEEIQLGAEMAAINRSERDGRISHQEAERERVNLQNAAEQKKFDEEQAVAKQKISDLIKEAAEDQEQANQKQAALQKSDDTLDNAGGARKQAEHAANAAQDALEAARKQADDLNAGGTDIPVGTPGGIAMEYSPEAAAKIADAEKKAKDLAVDAQKAQQQFKAADDEFTKALADQDQALKLRDDAVKKALDTKTANDKQIADEQQTANSAADEHAAKVAAEEPEDADKIDQGRKRDQTEQAKRQLDEFGTKFDSIKDEKSGRVSDDKKLSAIVEKFIKEHGDLNAESLDAFKRLDDAIRHNASETEKVKAGLKEIGRHMKYNAP